MTSLRKQQDTSSLSHSVSRSMSPQGDSGVGAVGSARGGKSLLGSGSYPAQESRTGGWEMRIRFGQLLVVWGLLAGMMLAVFFFGLYAGREQGIKIALEEHSGETVRLPIASPVAVSDSANSALMDPLAPGADSLAPGASAEIISRGSSPAGSNVNGGATSKTEDLKIDFGAEAKLAPLEENTEQAPIAESSTTVGLASKPTIQIFRDDLPAPNAPLAAAPGENTLAARVAGKNQDSKPSESAPVADAMAATELSKATLDKPVAKSTTVGSSANDSSSGTLSTGAAVTPAKVVKGKVTPGWYIQVAAARTSDEANKMVKRLQKTGQPVRTEEAKVSRGVYYRVIVGPYASKELATTGKKAVVAAKVAKGEPFLRYVK